MIRYIGLYTIMVFWFLCGCTDETKQHKDSQLSAKEELLVGTWVKSIDVGSKMIDLGFQLREDHLVNYINQPNTLGREWSLKGEDSLVLFYENQLYGDSIESAVYYIDKLNKTELRLKPRYSSEKYMDVYVRK